MPQSRNIFQRLCKSYFRIYKLAVEWTIHEPTIGATYSGGVLRNIWTSWRKACRLECDLMATNLVVPDSLAKSMAMMTCDVPHDLRSTNRYRPLSTRLKYEAEGRERYHGYSSMGEFEILETNACSSRLGGAGLS